MDYKEFKKFLRQKRLTTINGVAMNYLKERKLLRMQKEKQVKQIKGLIVN